MNKDFEKITKTTDDLRDFQSKIANEEKTQDIDKLLAQWQQEIDKTDVASPSAMDLNFLDDKTLELSDLEDDKTLMFSKTEIVDNVVKDLKDVYDHNNYNEEEITKKINSGLKERKKKKRLGLNLIFIPFIFIPVLLTFIIIGNHQGILISKNLLLGLKIVLIALVIMMVIGAIFYLKNYRIKIKHSKPILRYIYLFGMVTCVTGCVTILTLLYNITEFKDWLVTTAMATKDHEYLCQWFYSQDEINEVFSRNFIQETGESTDTSLIDVNIDEQPTIYANEYEKEILTRDLNQDYKIIRFEVNGCAAYLAVIYDPSLVHVTTTNKIGVSGQYVTTMAKREDAMVAINGSGFQDPGHTSAGGNPVGITIVRGKVVTNNEYGKASSGGLIGLTNDNKLVLLKNTTASQALNMGIRDAVSWGPFLIVNGKAAYTRGNGGWGYAARSAIGQRADGIILLLVVDSNYNRTKGANMVDMTEIMQRYGAINAANLDGGTSSVMVEKGVLINKPIDSAFRTKTRPIASAIVVTKK